MDQFLGISERIINIKRTLGKQTSEAPTPISSALAKSNESCAAASASSETSHGVMTRDTLMIMNSEAAEDYMRQYHSEPLEDDSLGKLEEDVREMFILLSECSAKVKAMISV
jgi:hypothetical protein